MPYKRTDWSFAVFFLVVGTLPAGDLTLPSRTAIVSTVGPRLPVVALLDDNADAILPQMTNAEIAWPSTYEREDRDFFSGASSVRIGQQGAPYQRFCTRLRGWEYRIKEKPGPGEYRYVRFAWKKSGGQAIMIQFYAGEKRDWAQRYLVGTPNVDWVSVKIGNQIPVDWQVVTRDLFKDFGEFTLYGLALSPLDGDYGLFDHFYLGRTVEDLDRVTAAALGKAGKPLHLTREEQESIWADLASKDSITAAGGIARLARRGEDTVKFIRAKLHPPPLTPAEQEIAKLIADLDNDRFAVRERAHRELATLGERALPILERLLPTTDTYEGRRRIMILLKQRMPAEGEWTTTQLRLIRVVRVLERCGTPSARELLQEFAAGKFDAFLSRDAHSAMERLAKQQ